MAVSVVLTGQIGWPVCLLGLGVCFWTAGFDILYSTADCDFDREHDLSSMPSRWGITRAVQVSRISFVLSALCFLGVGVMSNLGVIYFVGVGAVSLILAYEQWIVRDLTTKGTSSRLNQAFVTMNAFVSVVMFAFSQLDFLYGRFFS